MTRTSFYTVLAVLCLVSCTTAPQYAAPEMENAARYRNLDGKWQKSSDAPGLVDKAEWWTIFNDDTLNALVHDATKANQDLKRATAQWESARALYKASRASLIPRVFGGVNAARGGQAITGGSVINDLSASATVSYELDIFGRVRDTVAAARADAASREALLGQVQLAIQADVAQYYFTLLTLDTERDVVRRTVALREEAEKLLSARFHEGEVNEQDLLQAQAELANTRATLAALDEARTLNLHALAVLMGRHPSNFTLDEGKLPDVLPVVPAGLPSQLLERRPDIAAAQFRLRAALSRIGVARAAFFPSLTLSANGGVASPELSELFKWSSRAWSVGPLFGTALSVPIFEGGRNWATLDRVWADYDAAVAEYRQNVLVAFREVEDSLVTLNAKADQSRHLFDAAGHAGKAARLSDLRYREGESDYLEVIQTQRDELAAQRAYAQAQGARFAATVGLVRALGGGWLAGQKIAQKAQ